MKMRYSKQEIKTQIKILIAIIEKCNNDPNLLIPAKNALEIFDNGVLMDLFATLNNIYIQYSNIIEEDSNSDLPFSTLTFRDQQVYCVKQLGILVEDIYNNTKDYAAIFSKKSDIENRKSPIVGIKKVFIVHGRDEAVKQTVARFIDSLGLKAVILSEQANEGNTIIEKLEANLDCGFAIVLYTPCDKGKLSGEQKLNNRARQNVLFEHGLVVGRIGRSRVMALVKGDVEVPSDISGIVFEQYDDYNGWQQKIVRELKKAGYAIG